MNLARVARPVIAVSLFLSSLTFIHANSLKGSIARLKNKTKVAAENAMREKAQAGNLRALIDTELVELLTGFSRDYLRSLSSKSLKTSLLSPATLFPEEAIKVLYKATSEGVRGNVLCLKDIEKSKCYNLIGTLGQSFGAFLNFSVVDQEDPSTPLRLKVVNAYDHYVWKEAEHVSSSYFSLRYSLQDDLKIRTVRILDYIGGNSAFLIEDYSEETESLLSYLESGRRDEAMDRELEKFMIKASAIQSSTFFSRGEEGMESKIHFDSSRSEWFFNETPNPTESQLLKINASDLDLQRNFDTLFGHLAKYNPELIAKIKKNIGREQLFHAVRPCQN